MITRSKYVTNTDGIGICVKMTTANHAGVGISVDVRVSKYDGC